MGIGKVQQSFLYRNTIFATLNEVKMYHIFVLIEVHDNIPKKNVWHIHIQPFGSSFLFIITRVFYLIIE